MAEASVSGSGAVQPGSDDDVMCMTEVLKSPAAEDAVSSTPSQETTAAIAAFAPPAGHQRVVVRGSKINCSALFSWGVITEKIPVGDEIKRRKDGHPNKRFFHCFASDKCRKSEKKLAMTSKVSSGGTNHLNQYHGLAAASKPARAAKQRYAVRSMCCYETLRSLFCLFVHSSVNSVLACYKAVQQ